MSCQDKYGMSGPNKLILLHKMLGLLESQKAFDPV